MLHRRLSATPRRARCDNSGDLIYNEDRNGTKFLFQYRITIYLDHVEGRSRCEEESRREIDGRIIIQVGGIIGNINLLLARKKGGITPHGANAKVDIRRDSDVKGFHVECSDSTCMYINSPHPENPFASPSKGSSSTNFNIK